MKFKAKPIFYLNDNEKKFNAVKRPINAQSSFDCFFEPKNKISFCRASDARTLDTTSLWNPQLNENCSYFVFVTFVEIYNNYIYDLFDDDILNK
jgi:hypothetical protein